jgi:hypothetical protein
MVSNINSHHSLTSLSSGIENSIVLLTDTSDSEELAAYFFSFFPEDGSNRFLQNVNSCLLDTVYTSGVYS